MLRGVTLPFRLLFALGFALIVFVQFGRSIDSFDGMTNEQTPLGQGRELFFGKNEWDPPIRRLATVPAIARQNHKDILHMIRNADPRK